VQNSRVTVGDEEKALMLDAPRNMRSMLRGMLPYEANAAP